MSGNNDGMRPISVILTAQTSVAIDPAICDFIKNFSVGVQLDNVFINTPLSRLFNAPLYMSIKCAKKSD